MNLTISFDKKKDAASVDSSEQQYVDVDQAKMKGEDLNEVTIPTIRKSRPNHQLYLQALEKMGPDQRLAKAFELSELSRNLFLEGLRIRFPEKAEEEIKSIYLNRITKCYNRNY